MTGVSADVERERGLAACGAIVRRSPNEGLAECANGLGHDAVGEAASATMAEAPTRAGVAQLAERQPSKSHFAERCALNSESTHESA